MAGLQARNCIKKRLQHKHFPVKFTKFTEHLRWLLLYFAKNGFIFVILQDSKYAYAIFNHSVMLQLAKNALIVFLVLLTRDKQIYKKNDTHIFLRSRE